MQTRSYNKVYIAIPAMDEFEFLPRTLQCVLKQTYTNIETWVCVNQPEKYRDNEKYAHVVDGNGRLLDLLKRQYTWVHVIDKTSEGKGWQKGKEGVGQARKLLFDTIGKKAGDDSLLVSMDADTVFSETYIDSVVEAFNIHPQAVGLSVPYYHHCSNIDESHERAMLRYEIYLRNYALNMFRIGSPYRFTALGSAMVFPLWAYKKAGGIMPKTGGEDFYFLQKLVKYGEMLFYLQEKVYPSCRLSGRVPIGTGPALEKGMRGEWTSYSIYHYSFFDEVEETYRLFPELFTEDVHTPMDSFFKEIFGTAHIFTPLRKNYKDMRHFIRACHQKVDGLRVFQYVRFRQKSIRYTDERSIRDMLQKLGAGDRMDIKSFAQDDIQQLRRLRDYLVEMEDNIRLVDSIRTD